MSNKQLNAEQVARKAATQRRKSISKIDIKDGFVKLSHLTRAMGDVSLTYHNQILARTNSEKFDELKAASIAYIGKKREIYIHVSAIVSFYNYAPQVYYWRRSYERLLSIAAFIKRAIEDDPDKNAVYLCDIFSDPEPIGTASAPEPSRLAEPYVEFCGIDNETAQLFDQIAAARNMTVKELMNALIDENKRYLRAPFTFMISPTVINRMEAVAKDLKIERDKLVEAAITNYVSGLLTARVKRSEI